jgi:alpha-L-fucosidase
MTQATRRVLFGGAAAATALAGMAKAEHLVEPGFDQIATGPFKPTWDSLVSGYKAPDWFRDAKFGLWAHWGPQSVPEAGDWYARKMYIQGDPYYARHLKRYGHPADYGYMELLPQWRAENWDPEGLMDLYAKAGARYFVALANHHDNFDGYNSRFHDWNVTKVGPKKDIMALWAKAARKRGLRFGVSNHAAHAWHWFQTAYGYDPEGPRKGERYDAYRLNRLDGRGKWWEGLDPQELYGGPVMPLPPGLNSIAAANQWHKENDRVWTEKAPLANPAFTRQWFLRTKDLIDTYEPDLLYFDNFDIPLEQAGLDIVAHMYNASVARNGKQDVVINIKPQAGAPFRGGVTADVERGARSDISPEPWQTDTCLGDWFYDRERYLQKSYLPASAVIHRLCDIVSKNGNLLLSVPVRPDGTIDSEEQRIVEEIGGWMGRFSEAIYGTRPWTIFGEGPTEAAAGMFAEKNQKPFTDKDMRFTTKNGALYAIVMGRPASGEVLITSLAKGGPHAKRSTKRVTVVGARTALPFTQDASGLRVRVPDGAVHPFGVALRIDGAL